MISSPLQHVIRTAPLIWRRKSSQLQANLAIKKVQGGKKPAVPLPSPHVRPLPHWIGLWYSTGNIHDAGKGAQGTVHFRVARAQYTLRRRHLSLCTHPMQVQGTKPPAPYSLLFQNVIRVLTFPPVVEKPSPLPYLCGLLLSAYYCSSIP